ncbi:MAG: hypothetical protein Q9196_006019, partial [Gyalolechia fulgens]
TQHFYQPGPTPRASPPVLSIPTSPAVLSISSSHNSESSPPEPSSGPTTWFSTNLYYIVSALICLLALRSFFSTTDKPSSSDLSLRREVRVARVYNIQSPDAGPPFDKLQDGTARLNALHEALIDSSLPEREKLLEDVGNAQEHYRSTMIYYLPLYFSRVDSDADWSFNIAQLQSHVTGADEAAIAVKQGIIDVLKRRIEDVRDIRIKAHEYGKATRPVDQILARMNTVIGEAAVKYPKEKSELARKFKSQYLGLNKDAKQEVDTRIRTVHCTDQHFVEVQGWDSVIRGESEFTDESLKVYNQRLEKLIERAKAGEYLGVLDEMEGMEFIGGGTEPGVAMEES